jgi:hypothetical protein
LADIKAISIPEKKAMVKRQIKTVIQLEKVGEEGTGHEEGEGQLGEEGEGEEPAFAKGQDAKGYGKGQWPMYMLPKPKAKPKLWNKKGKPLGSGTTSKARQLRRMGMKRKDEPDTDLEKDHEEAEEAIAASAEWVATHMADTVKRTSNTAAAEVLVVGARD